MFSSIKKFFSTSNDRAIKKMMVSVNKINDLESELQDKPDSYFKELKNQLAKTYKEKNNNINEILPLAFARTADPILMTIRLYELKLLIFFKRRNIKLRVLKNDI